MQFSLFFAGTDAQAHEHREYLAASLSLVLRNGSDICVVRSWVGGAGLGPIQVKCRRKYRSRDPNSNRDGSQAARSGATGRRASVRGSSLPTADLRWSPVRLARWRASICPETLGLSPGFNSFVSARIGAVAAVIGAPHGEQGHCKVNVRILFTSEPKQVIGEIVKRDPAFLGFHYAQQTQRAATFDHPIQGWYMTATQGDRGNIALDNPNPIQQTAAALNSPVARALQSGTTPGGRAGTRLATGQDSLLVHALVIVDTKGVSGYPIGSISDYLAMLVLSQTRSPDACGPLPSILDLMAMHCGTEKKPEAVTAGDLAFLRALYSMDLRENLSLETNDIQNAMMREFKSH